MAAVPVICPHCSSTQKIAEHRIQESVMCLLCGNVIEDPYMHKIQQKPQQLDIKLKGRIVSEFGTTKLDELESKADEYTGRFEPVSDDTDENERPDETTRLFDTGMYSMPKSQATAKLSTAAKTYIVAVSAMVLLAVVVVVIGVQMITKDEGKSSEIASAGGGDTRVERYPSGAIKAEWSVSSVGGDVVPDGPWNEFHPNGEKMLQGQYANGNKVGKWLGWHKDGRNSLEAEYKDGLLIGKYTEWHSTGAKSVEGEYLDGKKHGVWREWYLDGGVKSNYTYDKGQPNDVWTTWHPNGQRETVGGYKNGKHDGVWITYHDNVVIDLSENWRNGLLDGETWGLYRNRQKRFSGQWKAGVKLGEWTWWHLNGELAKRGSYVDGIENGVWQEWHPNGRLKLKGAYDVGSKSGEWEEFDDQGDLILRTTFENGQKVEEKFYFRGSQVLRRATQYENGSVREEWTILKVDDGTELRHGFDRTFYSDGMLAEEGTNVDGQRDGPWRIYDQSGNLIRTDIYRNGELAD